MPNRQRSLLREVGNDFVKLHRANNDFSDLFRQLDHADIKRRIELAPIPLWLLGLSVVFLLILVLLRLPLHALRFVWRRGAVDARLKEERRADLAEIATRANDVAEGLAFWLPIPLAFVWVEVKILLHHLFIWGLVAVGYVILGAVLTWFVLSVLFTWP